MKTVESGLVHRHRPHHAIELNGSTFRSASLSKTIRADSPTRSSEKQAVEVLLGEFDAGVGRHQFLQD